MEKVTNRIAQLENEIRLLKAQLEDKTEDNRKLEIECSSLRVMLSNNSNAKLAQFILDTRTEQLQMSYINSADWEKITGISLKEAMSDFSKIVDIVHPDYVEPLMESIEHSAQTMTDHHHEFRLINNRWIQINTRPHRKDALIVWDGVVTDITEHKKAERELRNEKKRLQMLSDNIPSGALFQFVRHIRTRQMRFSYVSATWETVTGIPADIALNDVKQVFLTMQDQLPDFIKAIEQSARTMTDLYMEVCINDHLTQIIARPRSEGKKIVWDGIIFDITERKKAERALEESERNQRFVFENTREVYWVADLKPPYHITFAAGAVEEMFGCSREKLMQKLLYDFFEPEYGRKISELIEEKTKEFYKTGIIQTIQDEVQQYHIDGSQIWIEFSAQLVPDENGEITQLVGVDRNVTERKNAEMALKEIEKQHRENLEFLVQKRTEELATANKELENKNLLLAEALAEVQTANEELQASGEELSATNEALVITNDELDRYKKHLEQMVEQKTVELLQAKEKAEESNNLKSKFLANMSHEIRTPLNGILGFLQYVGSDKISPERREQFINLINQNSNQLVNIIDDIIDIAKIEAKQMTISPVPVSLNEMMTELRLFFETFLQTYNKGHIELILDASGSIDHCLACLDEVRLRQVLINLISNAVKFTDKGYIRFGYRQLAPDTLEFVIEDSGIGLPSDQLDLIFDTFRQVETTQTNPSRIYRGAGLGLAISRSMVQLMGGEIRAQSKQDVGSSFFFTLAYLPVSPDEAYIFNKGEYDVAPAEQPFAGKSVLIVEPVLLKLKYYNTLIAATGATVVSVESPQDMALYCCYPIDVIVADAALFDDEESVKHLRHIQKTYPEMSIILIVYEEKEKYKKLCTKTLKAPATYKEMLKTLAECINLI